MYVQGISYEIVPLALSRIKTPCPTVGRRAATYAIAALRSCRPLLLLTMGKVCLVPENALTLTPMATFSLRQRAGEGKGKEGKIKK